MLKIKKQYIFKQNKNKLTFFDETSTINKMLGTI